MDTELRKQISELKAPLDAIHSGAAILMDCAEALANIARALNRVGMRELADEVGLIGVDVGNARVEILGGVSRDLRDRVKASEEATVNMVRAAIVGASGTLPREPSPLE